MKKLFTLMILALVAVVANAVPAKPGLQKTIKLADGITVQVELKGDEFGHYWEAPSGEVFIKRENAYVKANREDVLKQIAMNRKNSQIEFERGSIAFAQKNQNTIDRANSSTSSLAPNGADGGSHLKGNKRCLVILAEFQDRKFEDGHNKAFYNRVCNEEGFSEGNFKGSTRDYFKDQSNGQLTIDFDVVGPVTLPDNSEYYAGDSGTANVQEFAYRAIKAADEEFDVDFSPYDWGNNGEVDEVFIIYAGDNMAEGGTGIWPHKSQTWNVDSGSYYNVDGKRIWVYACTSELNHNNDAAGIGTMCHEFSHCMGFPDLYDVDYKCNYNGMGYWDLMCSGSYNGNGYQPAGYSGFEKWCARWQYPIVLTEDEDIENVEPLANNGNFYVMYNNGNKNELYYMENRQQIGWDTSLYGNGLLVVHIDNANKKWDSAPNCMNRTGENHFCVELVCADGVNSNTYNSYQGDPFPYGKLDSLTNNSKIAGITYNPNSDGRYYMNQALKKIKRNSDGTVSFRYEAVNKTIVDIDVEGEVALVESFDQCDGEGGNDGKFSGTRAEGTFKTDQAGWDNGSKNSTEGLSGAYKCAFVDKSVGIRTPEFDVDGTYTIQFKAARWATQNRNLTVTSENADITISQTAFELDREMIEYTTTLTGTGKTRLLFKTSNGSFLIDGITVYIPASTGISTITDDFQKAAGANNNRIYNLNGQYVGNVEILLEKGIYIKNGKKFVVK